MRLQYAAIASEMFWNPPSMIERRMLFKIGGSAFVSGALSPRLTASSEVSAFGAFRSQPKGPAVWCGRRFSDR
jgi:hypothetical protein